MGEGWWGSWRGRLLGWGFSAGGGVEEGLDCEGGCRYGEGCDGSVNGYVQIKCRYQNTTAEQTIHHTSCKITLH